MKRNILILLALLLAFTLAAQVKPKYVFYFIGDGMGMNQVNATEIYLAAIDGRIGVKPLLFTQFPAGGMATTYSASSGVTDSAAAGTALAAGIKTKNGAIGVDTTLVNPLYSVAVHARRAGKKVAIATSCSLDDATPAAFYAHQPRRSMGYEIALDAIASGFDFFGGAGFSKPTRRADQTEGPNVYPLMEAAGYTLARGIEEYRQKAAEARKVILTEKADAPLFDLAYAIDRKESDLTLAHITEAAIEVLSRDNSEGFFMMVEGGTIDMACHANDAATAIKETIDLEAAVRVAYDFYLKHPRETLIVVAADHETGGMVPGTGSSRLNLQALQHQKMSQSALSTRIVELRQRGENSVSWAEIKDLLAEALGLWTDVPISSKQEARIREMYEQSFVRGDTAKATTLYQTDEKIAATAVRILNEIATIGWTSTNHSAGYVPVFAIGAGADAFNGKMDNTDIPLKIIEIAGYE